jgi:hypothetical protein
MIRHTSTTHAPWFVVPADHKWFTRVVVSEAIVETLRELKLAYPSVDASKRRELAEARRALENEDALERRKRGTFERGEAKRGAGKRAKPRAAKTSTAKAQARPRRRPK